MAAFLTNLFGSSTTIIIIALLWTLPWKGVALWKSARLGHKWWFVILLIVNTFAILDIIYIYAVARKYTVETVEK